MRFEVSGNQQNRLSPIINSGAGCGCGDVSPVAASDTGANSAQYIVGRIKTDLGIVPVVDTVLSRRDKWGTVKARIGSFRMKYRVNPGLYAVGSPKAESDVFVTANYKMSFDALRSALHGKNAWILVLDTNGINVWCAAGKGTFGTSELLKRIALTRLAGVVSHRKIVVPQLGAPGVDAAEVRRKSGFRVIYGPVRADDISAFIENGYRCNGTMRRVRFTIIDRLILTPIEIRQIMGKSPYFVLIVLIFFGLTPKGIIFSDAFFKGIFFLVSGLIAVFAGAFFTPVFLPFIPFRSFALKGWISGIVFIIPVLYGFRVYRIMDMFLIVAAAVLFPLLSSYMALQFTGASTYTNLTGVKREIKVSLPVYVSGGVVAFIFLLLYKVSDWGFL